MHSTENDNSFFFSFKRNLSFSSFFIQYSESIAYGLFIMAVLSMSEDIPLLIFSFVLKEKEESFGRKERN